MRKLLVHSAVILIFAFFSCNNYDSNSESAALENNKKEVKLKKNYSKSGRLMAEVEEVDGVKHGLTKNYAKSGKLRTTIQYKNGLKPWSYLDGRSNNGRSIW